MLTPLLDEVATGTAAGPSTTAAGPSTTAAGPSTAVMTAATAPNTQPAQSRHGIRTPLPPGTDPNEFQIQIRVTGLRLRIGHVAGIYDVTLRRILRDQRYDMDLAFAQWGGERGGARQRHLTNAPGRAQLHRDRDYLLAADTLHDNHRRAIDVLYQKLNGGAVHNPLRQIVPLRAAILLRESGWDVEQAIRDQVALETDAAETTRRARYERQLRMASPNACHQDRRLALLLNVLGTDDMPSARALLTSHAWDTALAIEDWMRGGLATVPATATERARVSYQAPRLLHPETANYWPVTRPSAGPLTGVDAADQQDALEDYGHGAYVGRTGWMVDYCTAPANVGVRVPEYMRQEAVRRGGRFAVYTFETVTASGTSARYNNPRAVAFDWNNPVHISTLNKWVVQPAYRTEGITRKPAQLSYHDQEQAWLIQWHLAEYERDFENNGVFTDSTKKFPFDVTKLHREFNQAFVGLVLPGTTSGPRVARSRAALDTQRHRMPELCELFNLMPVV